MFSEYKPSSGEIASAEEMLSDEERKMSSEREEVVNSLEPPHFDAKNNTILLKLDQRLIYLDRIIESAKSQGFVPKAEFHVTIIGFKNGKKISAALKEFTPEERQNKIDEIKDLIANTDWSLGSKPKVYRISKEYPDGQRETLIEALDLKNLDNFIANLNKILGTDIVPQFPHISLFTRGTDPEKSKMGIGIDTNDDFQNLNPSEFEPELLTN